MTIEKIICSRLVTLSKRGIAKGEKPSQDNQVLIKFHKDSDEPLGIMCPLYNEPSKTCDLTASVDSDRKCIYTSWKRAY